MKISVILNCHSEGTLIHRTLKGIQRMRTFAAQHHLTTEVIAVMDNPTDATVQYAQSHFPEDFSVYTVSFKDLGLSRNFGAEKASGKYIAFHDADDLYSQNWLVACYQLAESKPHQKIIFHAEYSVAFGTDENELHQRYSFNQKGFHCRSFFDFNPYDALAFAPRQVFLDNKYGKSGNGAGYEDWHWNLNTLAAGYEHYATPRTVLFIRRKREQSLLVFHLNNKSIVDRTPFFDAATYIDFYENAPQPIMDVSELIGLGRFRRACFLSLKRLVQWVKKTKKRKGNNFFSYKIDELLKAIIPIIKYFLFNGKKLKSVKSLPEWLVSEMQELNSIDAEVFITDTSVRRMHQYIIPHDSVLGEAYYEICKDLGTESYDHIVVGPWLKTGGADLVTVKYIQALVSENIAKKVLLILTEKEPSEWLNKIPENVEVMQFGQQFGYHSMEYQQKLLLRIFLQFGCTHVHLINSKLAYDTLALYGKLASQYVKIYPHAYCYEIDEFKNYRGYAFTEQNLIYPYVTKFLTENTYIIDFLTEMYAYDKKKFECIYQPVANIATSSRVYDEQTLRIMWAGRFDTQKRPHLLLNIAKRLLEIDPSIKIDVYGKKVLDNYFTEQSFEGVPSISYKGGYNGWESLNAEQYDIFLYTSQYDGMPNVVLEALSSTMIVVAPHQGGLPEIIEHEVNGFLVPNTEDVEPYVEAILKVKNNRNLKNTFYEVTRTKLQQQHSQAAFLSNVLRELK